MFIIKNALRNLYRAKGRSMLVGLIVAVIAFAACLGLSIRQAAAKARAASLADIAITAQISVDRSAMMQNNRQPGEAFDPSEFRQNLQQISSLTVEQLQTYAKAESVQSFYYTESISLNGSGLNPVESSSDDSSSNQTADSGRPGGFAPGGWGNQGDFTLVGYSSDDAMTLFKNGTCSITSGAIFAENTSQNSCVISDELAVYNNLSVGGVITLTNPNNEDETYTLTVAGIYHNEQSTVTSGGLMGGFSASFDPANQIYLSYPAAQAIADASAASAVTSTDDNGRETTTALRAQVSGTYVFADAAAYAQFETQARALGLSDDYTVSSADLTQYEQSLKPLETISQTATLFLLVVLGIGAAVLVILNIFNMRERKYEVGVLTAIGMKKRKVALQFITEVLTVTLLSVILGGAVGAAVSVPVTNSLLAAQVEAQQTTQQNRQDSFGRPSEMGGMQGITRNNANITYISSITQATDTTVLLQLLALGIALALAAGAGSVIFIMRYDPLKILSNRD